VETVQTFDTFHIEAAITLAGRSIAEAGISR